MTKDVMVDIETMGTAVGSAIISIGAVCIEGGVTTHEFYRKISLKSCVRIGLTIDPATVMWWMQRSEEARKEFFSGDEMEVFQAFVEFEEWFKNYGDEDAEDIIWGNGSDFDMVLMADVYRRMGRKTPWKYYNARCYRTLKCLFPEINMDRKGTHHNALDDARDQANHLIKLLEQVRHGQAG